MASSARAEDDAPSGHDGPGSDNSSTGIDGPLPSLPTMTITTEEVAAKLVQVERNDALLLQKVYLPTTPLGYTTDVMGEVQTLAVAYAIDALAKKHCCCVQLPARHGKTRTLINLAHWEDAKVGGMATIVVTSERALRNIKAAYNDATVIKSDGHIPADTTLLLVDNADFMPLANLVTLFGDSSCAWVVTCSTEIDGAWNSMLGTRVGSEVRAGTV